MHNTIDINTVSALEIDVFKDDDIPALITVGGRLYVFRGIMSGGDDILTVGYVPYVTPNYMKEWIDEIKAHGVVTTPCRMFADTDALFSRGIFKGELGTFEYINGSDDDQKVCVWNSLTKLT